MVRARVVTCLIALLAAFPLLAQSSKPQFEVASSWLFEVRHSGWPKQPGATALDTASPSISAALEEQLGLKLEQRRGPVEMLVIDAVHRPTEN